MTAWPSMRDILATPTLTDNERHVIELRYLLDYPTATIASDLGITVSAVNHRLANARRKIVDHHHLEEKLP